MTNRATKPVNSTTGFPYRVNPETGVATQVDLGGTSLTAGDGLLVLGTTLYVVRNSLDQVAVIKLNADGTSGQLVNTLTSDDFDTPTTVAAFGNTATVRHWQACQSACCRMVPCGAASWNGTVNTAA